MSKNEHLYIPTEDPNNKGLRELDAVDAMKLAVALSGKHVTDIAKEMDTGLYLVRRWFSTEKYFPSFEDIPLFCRTVGNMTLINWLQVQAMAGDKVEHSDINCAALVGRVGELFGEMGDVGLEAQEAVKDGILESFELRRVIKEVTEVVAKGNQLVADLRIAERALAEAEKIAAEQEKELEETEA